MRKHAPYFLSAEQIDDFGIIRITWIKETEAATGNSKGRCQEIMKNHIINKFDFWYN